MELLITLTDLDVLLVTLFTWSLTVTFSSRATPRNLTGAGHWTGQILNLNFEFLGH